MIMKHLAPVILLLLLISPALARQANESAAANESAMADSHPVLSTDIRWSYRILSTIVIMFVLAFAVGQTIRQETPQVMPPVHSHDEPPGASGHHGPGGTADPNAPDAHHH